MGNQREALIVGSSTHNLWGLPYLLSRAGFVVDAIATERIVRYSKFVRNAYLAESIDEMMRLAHQHICARATPYDWIIPAEDGTLKAFAELEWPSEVRPEFLPETAGGRPSWFFSKIGLSQALHAAGIQTPPFRVVSTRDAAVAAAREIGYPVMIKVDASCGGGGIGECSNDADVIRDVNRFGAQQLLVQKTMKGREIAFDAIFVRGELAHFACADPVRLTGRFAPSCVRKYFPLPLVEKRAFDELTAIGRALGADGMANIKCIDAEDGSGHYYFEADFRSSVWMDLTGSVGVDPAERIRQCFSTRTSLTRKDVGSPAKCSPVIVPCFLRLKCWELLVNRYRVWKFIPFADTTVVVRLLIAKMFWRTYCLFCALLPKGLKAAVKRLFALLFMWRVPNISPAAK